MKEYQKTHGEPDVIQIRRIFKTKESAINWEEKVLRRLNVLKTDKWLNANIRGVKFSNEGSPRSLECRKKISQKRINYLKNLTCEEREIVKQNARAAGVKGAKKIGEKARERLSDPIYLQKHIDAHNTPEYLENLSKKVTEAYQREDVKQRHLKAVHTREYREKISRANIIRFSVKENREKISKSLKQTLASPEHRQLMSDRAKSSTEKRLQSRKLNKEIKMIIKNTSLDLAQISHELFNQYSCISEKEIFKRITRATC